MNAPRIAVFDYSAGNVYSVCQALERLGANVSLTADPAQVRAADGLVVPGVGAFGYVVSEFRKRGGEELLRERLDVGAPVLGVCVGLQILFESSGEKGAHPGLGVLSGSVDRLPAERLPNMGWERLAEVPPNSAMLDGITDAWFYFVHSYARLLGPMPRDLWQREQPVSVAVAEHGSPFVAALEAGPLWATQFHPEKSGRAGLRLLHNWIDFARETCERKPC